MHTLEEIGWSPPRPPPLDDADSIGSDYAGVMTDEQYNAALGVRFPLPIATHLLAVIELEEPMTLFVNEEALLTGIGPTWNVTKLYIDACTGRSRGVTGVSVGMHELILNFYSSNRNIEPFTINFSCKKHFTPNYYIVMLFNWVELMNKNVMSCSKTLQSGQFDHHNYASLCDDFPTSYDLFEWVQESRFFSMVRGGVTVE